MLGKCSQDHEVYHIATSKLCALLKDHRHSIPDSTCNKQQQNLHNNTNQQESGFNIQGN